MRWSEVEILTYSVAVTAPWGLVSTHLEMMGMVELSPSLREGREVPSGEGRAGRAEGKQAMTANEL